MPHKLNDPIHTQEELRKRGVLLLILIHSFTQLNMHHITNRLPFLKPLVQEIAITSQPAIRLQPLPEKHEAPPMQANPPSSHFTRTDFMQGRVTAQRLLELYKSTPVQHRGNRVVKNEAEFEEVVGVPLAPNASFESTIATLGPALFGITGGTHPVVDFRQPVAIPEGHPPVPFFRVIKGQRILGFPNEVGHLEHEEPGTAPPVTNAPEDMASDKGRSVLNAAHKFAAEMTDISSDEENGR